MGLFSSPQSYIGVDFDSSSIKIVELKSEAGRPKLVTYGYIDFDVAGVASGDLKSSHPNTASIIKQVVKKANVTTTKAITSLPAFSVFSSILNLPSMSKKDLTSAIKWEAKKVIPLPLEEMILDWKILEEEVDSDDLSEEEVQKIEDDTSDDDSKEKGFLNIKAKVKNRYTKILLTAAPKDLVKNYINIFTYLIY